MALGFAEEKDIDDFKPLLVPAGELLKDQRVFLSAFLNIGTIRGAERASKINHLYHYQWLDEDSNYLAAFTRIKAILVDHEIDKVKTRGIDGYDEPLAYKGELTGASVKKYDTQIALAYIKANRPEWRDGYNQANAAVPISIAITYPSPPSPNNGLTNVGEGAPAAKKINHKSHK